MTTTAEANGQGALVPRAADAPALVKAATVVPQYAQGFEGAASGAFPAEANAVLTAGVNPEEVEVKPNGIVYLPGVSYRRILIRAFGAGAWALLPRGPARTMGEIVIYHGALYILGRFVSEAVGECETRGGMSYASSLEGARTDCLTRCCKDLGVAAELWDPEWRDGWLKKYCDREKDERGKWKFWKLDKPNAAPAPIAGRNSGGKQLPVAPTGKSVPKGDVASVSPSAATDAESAGSADATETTTTSSWPDTGDAPNAAELAAVRDAAKVLKWSKPKATSWLKGNFGQTSADALTKDQCASALALLMAAQLDDNDDAYSKIYDRLKAEGKVGVS